MNKNDLKHKLTCLISGMDGEPKGYNHWVGMNCPNIEGTDANYSDYVIWITAKETADKIIEETGITKGAELLSRWNQLHKDVDYSEPTSEEFCQIVELTFEVDEYLSSLNL